MEKVTPGTKTFNEVAFGAFIIVFTIWIIASPNISTKNSTLTDIIGKFDSSNVIFVILVLATILSIGRLVALMGEAFCFFLGEAASKLYNQKSTFGALWGAFIFGVFGALLYQISGAILGAMTGAAIGTIVDSQFLASLSNDKYIKCKKKYILSENDIAWKAYLENSNHISFFHGIVGTSLVTVIITITVVYTENSVFSTFRCTLIYFFSFCLILISLIRIKQLNEEIDSLLPTPLWLHRRKG